MSCFVFLIFRVLLIYFLPGRISERQETKWRILNFSKNPQSSPFYQCPKQALHAIFPLFLILLPLYRKFLLTLQGLIQVSNSVHFLWGIPPCPQHIHRYLHYGIIFSSPADLTVSLILLSNTCLYLLLDCDHWDVKHNSFLASKFLMQSNKMLNNVWDLKELKQLIS